MKPLIDLSLAKLKTLAPLLLILFGHVALSISYSSLIPLGEAPDEQAQLNYARFIAETRRLPATLAERQAADYRSNWPPLYYVLIAGPVGWVGNDPPTRLKAVGDTARRLIPTNGQTIAAFIHTEDEAWPWRGLPLAWHLSRFISLGLTALAVLVTYLIAWHLTRRRDVATVAAAIHAFTPQVLFIGSVVNDDNLLVLLSGLILLVLVYLSQRKESKRLFGLLSWAPALLLGLLLGLATVTKYNALPLWGVVAVWSGWHIYLTRRKAEARMKTRSLAWVAALLGGMALSGGWWFVFIWRHFNQVEQLGWLRGSFAALVASTSDTTLRNLTTSEEVNLPPVTAWLDWFIRLFQSFWGRFGGSGSIAFPPWVYWLLALFCFLVLLPLILRHKTHYSLFTIHYSLFTLFLLIPLFFLPLLLLRFILTGGNITETAQGRHLFPALSAIAVGLAWGLIQLPPLFAPFRARVRPTTDDQRTRHASRITHHAPPFMLIIFLMTLSLTGLPLIRRSYPPPIPLLTTAKAATVENRLDVALTDSLTLIGYNLDPTDQDVLPVTLVWQAETIPSQDYLISLSLIDSTGQPLGGWLGHPVGGRYPTRAWDKGDIVRHRVPVPLLPGLSATTATLTLQLFDSLNQPASEPFSLTDKLFLPATPKVSPGQTPPNPFQLRTDGLPEDTAFTYRSTLSFIIPGNSLEIALSTPGDQIFAPDRMIDGSTGHIAHFIVAANWPSGVYQLSMNNEQLTMNDENSSISNLQSLITNYQLPIKNRPRQFTPPPLTHPVNANFGGVLTLLGYDLPQRRVKPGESVPITLHWRAETTLGQNLAVFNHLLDANLTQRGGRDRIPQNFYTTLLWVPGEIVSDAYAIPVEADAPSGVYWLDVGLYPTERPNFSLPLFVEGQPIGRNSVAIGPLKVGGPPPDVSLPDAAPQYPLQATFSEQITLLGFDVTDDAGNPVPLDPNQSNSAMTNYHLSLSNLQSPISNLYLYWQIETPPATDYTVFVHLLDAQGQLVEQFDGPPAAGLYPTSLWERGEIIVDRRIMTAIPPGHTLKVGLYRADTGERLTLPQTADGALTLLSGLP